MKLNKNTKIENIECNGDVFASGDLYVGEKGINVSGKLHVMGSLICEGEVNCLSADIAGDCMVKRRFKSKSWVDIGGDFTVDSSSQIHGWCRSKGRIDLKGSAIIKGKVESTGKLTASDYFTCYSDVFGDSIESVGEDFTSYGYLRATHDMQFQGDLCSGGNICVSDGDSELFIGGDLSMKGAFEFNKGAEKRVYLGGCLTYTSMLGNKVKINPIGRSISVNGGVFYPLSYKLINQISTQSEIDLARAYLSMFENFLR